jgi:AraC-like DNA-binding protein
VRPPAAWPDFETLAQQFHASCATLRRDLAIALLSDSQLSMADIADELGFAEISAFHRAFKKCTGSRPGDYRYGME